MVVGMNEAPLFWYIYYPNPRYAQLGDGGFAVELYDDGILTYKRYDQEGCYVENTAFQLPLEVTRRFQTILESQTWWMGSVPKKIEVKEEAVYTSQFGFRGYPLFLCEEINRLVLSKFNSRRGMYARRLRMMLESISEMLYDYGIGLTVNSFTWDWYRINPVTPDAMNTAQMVMPSEEELPMMEEEFGDEEAQ